MKNKPYVGITGFKRIEEIEGVNRIVREEFSSSPYQVMFGYLCSEKRLANLEQEGKLSPALSHLPKVISAADPSVLTMIHYHSTNKENLAQQVERVFTRDNIYSSGSCQSLQLNVDWPPLNEVERIITLFPEMKIVLQLPQRAMEGRSISEIADLASTYAPFIAYTLVDPSGGKGKEIDLPFVKELVYSLQEKMPQVNHGFAGGFCAENIEERLALFPKGISFDAQGKIRSETGLDLDKCTLYLKTASRFVK
ncbi:MAG: hypothetical protein WCV90_06825 [Candidatus Woesearchaeota archaeon]|jgi:phosphoribosylanthranilate isomerase